MNTLGAMGFAIGVLLLVLGVIAMWVWSAAVLMFLQGLLAFALVLWGVLTLIVALSGAKSKRQLGRALNDEPSSLESRATKEAPDAADVGTPSDTVGA